MSPPPDWRDSKAYEALRDADRSALSWEWLRRDPGYCEAFRHYSQRYSTETAAELVRWGLHAWVQPALGARDARPVWRADRHPQVLQARADASAADADSFDLARWAPLATLIVDGKTSHLLLNDGRHALRLDVDGEPLTAGPVRLHYALNGFASLSAPLSTLRRLREMMKTGKIGEPSAISSFRRARYVLLLRAWDGHRSEASQREIGRALFGDERVDQDWDGCSDSLRSRVRRLVRDARAMARGGYRVLLRKGGRSSGRSDDR